MTDRYESPLSSRYASEYMLHLFSQDVRYQTWRKLWVSLARAEHKLGLGITEEQVKELEAHITDIDYAVAAEREKLVRHDVMAHVYAYGQVAPSAAGIIHLGATSCYVTDNADIVIYRDGLRYLKEELKKVLANLRDFAETYKAMPTLGYTHYQPAQLVTVGKRATLWMQDLASDLEELDFVIDFAKFREVADAVGAYLMVDMAHIAGLVAAGLHPSPIPYADVVTTTTHKTLRGPRGGLILCNDEAIYKKINSAVFPGTQGGPLEHIIAAKAVCFGEALKPEFKAYAEQIVKNAKVLAEELVKEGFRLVSGGTDNHLCLVDVRNFHITGKEFERRLDEVQITVNKNAIPNDPEKPFVTSGVRVGTPAVTSRGFKEPEMVQIAHWMGQTARDFDTCREQVRSEVDALCRKFPIYQ